MRRRRRSLVRRAGNWACLAALLLTACGDRMDERTLRGAGDRPHTGGTLTAGIAGDPESLDPHRTTAYTSFQVLENVYDTLVEPGDDLRMAPALADRWEVSDDHLTWTFTLRDGVKWHNGRDLLASDVVYSYERIRREGQNAYRLDSVARVRAPDRRTVVLELERPTPNLLVNLGLFKGMAIVPREIVEDGSIAEAPVGTGPFRFGQFVAGDKLVLERNPAYWRDGLPHLDRIVFRPIPDPTVKLTNLIGGQVDWVDNVPPQRLDELEARPGVVVETVIGGDYWYLATNLRRQPFARRQVRRALAFAIDRAAVARAAKFEAATPNQTAIPKTSPWYHAHAPYEPDPERARRLLAAAGVEGGLRMGLMVTNEFPETVTAAQVIASQLADVGIRVEIQELDFSAWLAEQSAGRFDALLLGWLGNLDPEDFYHAQHHSEGEFNFHGYANRKVDELLESGRVETDRQARKELYDRAAELIVDDASYIYLYNSHQVNAWRPRVGGYHPRPDAAVRFGATWIAH